MAYRLQPLSTTDYKVALPTINKNFQELDKALVTQKFSNADGTQVLEGLLPDGTYGTLYYRDGVPNVLLNGTGIKVAQDGIDVFTATPDQLVMSSEFNMLKRVAEGTQTVTHPANVAFHLEPINHGLGARPIIIAFVTDPGGDSKPLPNVVFGLDGTIDHAQEIQSIGVNDFTFRSFVRPDQPDYPFPSTVSIKWLAFLETAN